MFEIPKLSYQYSHPACQWFLKFQLAQQDIPTLGLQNNLILAGNEIILYTIIKRSMKNDPASKKLVQASFLFDYKVLAFIFIYKLP